MNIYPISLDIVWESPQENLNRIEKEILSHKADVFVLPELCTTGFTMNPGPYAESVPGPTSEYLCRLAKETRSWIIGSCIESHDPKPKNAAFAIDRSGQIVNVYRKEHLFNYAGEDRHYSPGEPATVFDLDGVQAAVQICFDLRYPESFRALRDDGAEMVFVIASWPEVRKHHWFTLLAARAIENQMIVCGVNRIGPGYNFPGSIIFDEQGLEIKEPDFNKLRKWRKDFQI